MYRDDSGYMTLEVEPGSKLPENIGGTVHIENVKARYTSLSRSKSQPNTWIVPKVDWEAGSSFFAAEEEDHEIMVLGINDDDGNPYVLLCLSLGETRIRFLGMKGTGEGGELRGRKQSIWDMDTDELEGEFSKRLRSHKEIPERIEQESVDHNEGTLLRSGRRVIKGITVVSAKRRRRCT